MNWEPWTGCVPYSEGCKFCYYYGPYAKRYGQNEITKTDKFDWPIRSNAKGELCIKGGKTIATCFATDFFISGADEWRKEAWAMIKERQDLDFMILTKRIDRFYESLPEDWGEGYDNVYLGCTVETQAIADYRLPLFLSYPIKRRFIACGPLLERIDLQYLAYQSEADLFGTQDIPPLRQTIEEVVEEYNSGVVLKIEDENIIIGSVRTRCEAGTVHIGKLMVHPRYRKRGLGKRLLSEVEVIYPKCRYELFTSTLSVDNIRLYESIGYTEYKREKINDMLTFVYLEKK